jgi:hypothetical protein
VTIEQPIWMQQSVGDPTITYTGQQLRVMTDIMSFLSGVTLKNDLKVSQRGAGANMSVDVAAGSCVVAGLTVTYQGKYLCRSTAVVNVAISAAPGSGTRTDLVVARVYDDQADGLGQYMWQPEVFTGSSVPSGASYIPLAKVTVAAGTASITSGMIDGSVRLLNTMGDVPMWEVSGGNGQSVSNSGAGDMYNGWTVSDQIGMASVTTSNGAVIALPGRYIVTLSARLDTNGASSLREAQIRHLRSAANVRRATIQVTSKAGTGLECQPPMATTATFRCLAGDVIQPFHWQNSTSTLHINDVLQENFFTGVWVGP